MWCLFILCGKESHDVMLHPPIHWYRSLLVSRNNLYVQWKGGCVIIAWNRRQRQWKKCHKLYFNIRINWELQSESLYGLQFFSGNLFHSCRIRMLMFFNPWPWCPFIIPSRSTPQYSLVPWSSLGGATLCSLLQASLTPSEWPVNQRTLSLVTPSIE